MKRKLIMICTFVSSLLLCGCAQPSSDKDSIQNKENNNDSGEKETSENKGDNSKTENKDADKTPQDTENENTDEDENEVSYYTTVGGQGMREMKKSKVASEDKDRIKEQYILANALSENYEQIQFYKNDELLEVESDIETATNINNFAGKDQNYRVQTDGVVTVYLRLLNTNKYVFWITKYKKRTNTYSLSNTPLFSYGNGNPSYFAWVWSRRNPGVFINCTYTEHYNGQFSFSIDDELDGFLMIMLRSEDYKNLVGQTTRSYNKIMKLSQTEVQCKPCVYSYTC